MTLVFQPTNRPFDIQADRTEETTGGLILHGAQANVHLPIPPQSYYRHGWQSWSLTTWQAANFQLPTLKPAILHPLQTDPLYALYPTPNGSWLGAVELEKEKVLLLGSLGLEAHVALHGQQSQGDAARLHGWYEAGAGDCCRLWGSLLFARYAGAGQTSGTAPGKPTPRVCAPGTYGAVHEACSIAYSPVWMAAF
jgi:hypothetical protein